MLHALLLIVQAAAATPVAVCSVPGDPQQRTWTLERRGTADDAAWSIAFHSRALDRPRVELRLPNVSPVITPQEIRVSMKSANGGRMVEWRIAGASSSLDLYVNHGLEVNVEPDLDPAVDALATDGPLSVVCDKGSGLFFARDDQSVAAASTGSTSNGLAATNLDGISVGNNLKESRPLSPELIVAVGVARSVNLFQSTAGRSYAVQTIGWGRELTRDWGPGIVRGRFVWAIEAMPIFAQFSPAAIYGVGFAPLVWRWNFTPQPRWSAFAELAMGGLWTTDPIPEGTSRGNFTAHWGAGVRLLQRGAHSLLLAYRFQHFSNGNQLGSNPGVNSHVVMAGWSYRS